jgi:hypothetical protein
MINTAEKIYQDLDVQLALIEQEQVILLKRAELSMLSCENALEELRKIVFYKKVKTVNEEITFFKKIKPRFFSLLIYYAKVVAFEKAKLPGNKLYQLSFLEKAQQSIENFYEENRDFHTYYITGSTSLDDRYFVRNKLDTHMVIDEYYVYLDRSFSTFHETMIARFLAYKRLSELIEQERHLLLSSPNQPENSQGAITWTDNKTSLIELLYALNTAGTFNRGTIELKELANSFSKNFNIDLGDFYRTWSEIKLRKEPTKFLDTLKFTLENRIKQDME